MGKRGLMAATAILMLILADPTGPAASASKDDCPKGRTKEQCQACAEAAPYKVPHCGQAAKDCHSKYTVQKVDADKRRLEVTYPPSVWSVTKEDLSETEKAQEKEYKKDAEKLAPYKIRLTAKSKTPTEGKTYLFTRCPEDDFTLGTEISPDDPTIDDAPTSTHQKP